MHWNGMEWVHIPPWDGYRLGWHGQKIPFSLCQLCLGGYQKGLADSRDHQRFSVLETDTAQFTLPSPTYPLMCVSSNECYGDVSDVKRDQKLKYSPS